MSTYQIALAVPLMIIGSVADLLIICAAAWAITVEYRKVIKKMRQTRIRKQSTRKPAPREIDTRTPSGRPLPY